MVSKQKILIVDDDNNIAELIALYLTKECFETKIVGIERICFLSSGSDYSGSDASGNRRLSGMPRDPPHL